MPRLACGAVLRDLRYQVSTRYAWVEFNVSAPAGSRAAALLAYVDGPVQELAAAAGPLAASPYRLAWARLGKVVEGLPLADRALVMYWDSPDAAATFLVSTPRRGRYVLALAAGCMSSSGELEVGQRQDLVLYSVGAGEAP